MARPQTSLGIRTRENVERRMSYLSVICASSHQIWLLNCKQTHNICGFSWIILAVARIMGSQLCLLLQAAEYKGSIDCTWSCNSAEKWRVAPTAKVKSNMRLERHCRLNHAQCLRKQKLIHHKWRHGHWLDGVKNFAHIGKEKNSYKYHLV